MAAGPIESPQSLSVKSYASVIALAERLGTPTVLTLDRRHFAAVRRNRCDSLQLLPESR